MDESKETLNELKKTKPFEGQEREVKNLTAEVEKLENKLKDLRNLSFKSSLSAVKNIEFNSNKLNDNYSLSKSSFRGSTEFKGDLSYIAKNMKDLKIETSKTNSEVKKFGKNTNDSFQKGITSLKRFGLSLLSLGSMYALVSKASSAYLSQDTALAQKLQNVWVGLGAFLVPAIEMISDALLKGLGYLNEFVKALTGVDFIANANAKALQKQASAQKELNNQTYSFDEMNIQQKQSTSSISNSSGSGLIEIPELDDGLVKKLQDLAYWLRENWDWISKVGIALGVAFGAVKIAGFLSNIGKLIGSSTLGTGLSGLAGLLGVIAVAWLASITIEGIGEAIEQTKTLNDELNKNTYAQQTQTQKTRENVNELVDMAIAEEWTTEKLKNLTNYLKNTSTAISNQNANLEENKDRLWWNASAVESLTEEQKGCLEEIMAVNEGYAKLYEAGLLNEVQTQDYAESLKKQGILMENLGIDVNELYKKYINLTNQNYNINVNANMVDNFSWQFRNLINKFQNIGVSVIADIISTSKNTRAFATGGIVTQPTRALIGEAGYPEAVVPMTADYLSTLASMIAQYSGGNGNPVNIYLDGRLIQRQVANTSSMKDFATNS